LFAALITTTGVITSQSFAAEEEKIPGKISFVAKNTIATANGTFHKWRFTKTDLDLKNLKDSVVSIEVDVASIDTKNKKRDNHLRTKDFFEVENYPKATLKIYDITKVQAKYKSKLEWSMHGVTKTYDNFTFEIDSTDPLKVKGTFKINRMDFKIGKKHSKLIPTSIKEEIPITFEATIP
jgi:polyisoprenoid-binding protein YceI